MKKVVDTRNVWPKRIQTRSKACLTSAKRSTSVENQRGARHFLTQSQSHELLALSRGACYITAMNRGPKASRFPTPTIQIQLETSKSAPIYQKKKRRTVMEKPPNHHQKSSETQENHAKIVKHRRFCCISAFSSSCIPDPHVPQLSPWQCMSSTKHQAPPGSLSSHCF